MPLLIDGYNLLHASGILGHGRARTGLERARNALLNMLAESLPAAEVTKTTVVFDANNPPWGLGQTANHQGIHVHFASRHDDADSLIEELINADSSPKRLIVVSSDHRLHKAAKRRKAVPIDSDKWFSQLLRDRQQRGLSAAEVIIKPEGPFSPGEVDFWLKQFDAE